MANNSPVKSRPWPWLATFWTALQARRTRHKGAEDSRTSLVMSLITSSVISGLILPVIASGLTLGFYLSPLSLFPPRLAFLQLAPRWEPIVSGIIGAIVAWIIALILLHPFVTKEGAAPQLYDQLKSSLQTLQKHLEEKKDKSAVPKAQAYLDSVKKYLEKPPSPVDMRWISGTGYLDASRMLHRAEEALILAEETSELKQEGLLDRDDLKKSTMSDRDAWLQKLQLGIDHPDSCISSCFKENQPWKDFEEQLKTHLNSHHPLRKRLRKTAGDGDQENQCILLQEVRRVLNTHRENLWESMLLLRNHLLGALVSTGVVSYALICLLVLIGADRDAIVAGLAFYIVGAIAGLFGRFYGELNRTDITSDYGLSTIRLIATPMFSGWAGVAGAFLTVVITVLSGQQSSSPTLEMIFRPAPLNLFIAAVFGLTPNLVMQSLQRQAETYKVEVKHTEAQPSMVGTQKG